MNPRLRSLSAPIGAAALLSLSPAACGSPPELPSQPNFLIIITDDQRDDTMEYMPRTNARIFEQGVSFPNAYVTTSRCCPSRASILTGMAATTHGVLLNSDKLHETTFVERLDEAGYFTGVVGKYLNSYPTSERDPPLPEFDFWLVFKSPQTSFYDVRFDLNGTWGTYGGFMTFILRDFAQEFLRLAALEDAPFMLIFAPYAPHLPADPAPGDENLYADLPPFRPPNFDEEDVSDKPEWLQESNPPLTDEQIANIDEYRRRQAQNMKSLDESIDYLLNILEQQGELDNTVVIFMSDNGLFWGEHRFESGKLLAYEPSVRVPFAVRYPPLAPKPRVDERLVANIDIAPTIYELAGIPIPARVDGLSLAPLLEGQRRVAWREHLVMSGWPHDADYVDGLPFLAIHTGRYVYIETEGDRDEFYDIEEDPYQLQNQVENPDYAEIVADLRARLEQERAGISPTPVPTVTPGP